MLAYLVRLLPSGELAGSQPTACHAGLREGEGQEDANGVQRDQGRDAGLEDDDQHARHQRKEDDAAREDQPAAPEGQVTRQEAIGGQQRAESGKVGKRRVRGHDQDHGRRSDHQIVSDTLAIEYRACQLRNHRFRRRGHCVNLVAQEGDRQQQHAED